MWQCSEVFIASLCVLLASDAFQRIGLINERLKYRCMCPLESAYLPSVEELIGVDYDRLLGVQSRVLCITGDCHVEMSHFIIWCVELWLLRLWVEIYEALCKYYITCYLCQFDYCKNLNKTPTFDKEWDYCDCAAFTSFQSNCNFVFRLLLQGRWSALECRSVWKQLPVRTEDPVVTNVSENGWLSKILYKMMFK